MVSLIDSKVVIAKVKKKANKLNLFIELKPEPKLKIILLKKR